MALYYIKLAYQVKVNLENSLHFDQLIENIEKGWLTSFATSVENVLKRNSTLLFTNLEHMTKDKSCVHINSINLGDV